MKKILLLGGSAQQVVAIETAKRLGYFTILCDFLIDNPGRVVADKFYLVSTTDREEVLKIAQNEKIDGVLAYASDPAAPTAAYVAEKMKLHTNPYKSVEILCNKDRFRLFLEQNGFNAPMSKGFGSSKTALNVLKEFDFPVIIKPVDSSGSKGVSVLFSAENAVDAINKAFSFSRTKRIIIEKYIEKKHDYLIGGDIFVKDGQVCLWGLLNCHRDNRVNPLVPVGKSYPICVSENVEKLIKNVLQLLIEKLEIKFGALNVELVIDKEDRVWLIDVGPRNGGNMIPDLLGYIFSVNIVEMSIKAVMGEEFNCVIDTITPYYATHNLHSDRNGKFNSIIFSNELEQYIKRKCIYKKYGDSIEYFDNASKALGIIFMQFDCIEEMFTILKHINQHIEVVLD